MISGWTCATSRQTVGVLLQSLGNVLDRGDDVLLGLGLQTVKRLELQRNARAASTVPAQVRKSLAVNSSPAHLAEIVVHVGRVGPTGRLPSSSKILKQRLAPGVPDSASPPWPAGGRSGRSCAGRRSCRGTRSEPLTRKP